MQYVSARFSFLSASQTLTLTLRRPYPAWKWPGAAVVMALPQLAVWLPFARPHLAVEGTS